ncbi:ribosome silencing factor [uncultured Acetobacteroides sp.]|uniref:ribosome silencing factor n=1 Tax=uncultured Acetobacteroides sp. TaxID=1760811 RepID=UPI0029F4F6AF|nr:ribosome silencing factor [uncultured Acetobacteroides sp.]
MAKQTSVKDHTQELVTAIVEAADDKKGENIVSLDLRKLDNAVCQYFIVCNANSTTQVGAIADGVHDKVLEKTGEKPWHSEGYDNCLWVLLDYGDVVLHVFQTEQRDFYKLEDLWADAKRVKHG